MVITAIMSSDKVQIPAVTSKFLQKWMAIASLVFRKEINGNWIMAKKVICCFFAQKSAKNNNRWPITK